MSQLFCSTTVELGGLGGAYTPSIFFRKKVKTYNLVSSSASTLQVTRRCPCCLVLSLCYPRLCLSSLEEVCFTWYMIIKSWPSLYWQVSLGTGFGSLLHYVKLVDETSSIDILYFVITGVSTFFTLILIVTLVLNLQQNITTSTKNGNLFVSMVTIRHFRNEKGTANWGLKVSRKCFWDCYWHGRWSRRQRGGGGVGGGR